MNNLIQGVDYHRMSIVPGQRCQQLKTHLFHVGHPFVERLLVEGAEEGYPGFFAAAPQLVARPLTQFNKEWRCNCTLSEWVRLGYSLSSQKFCSDPQFLPLGQIGLLVGVSAHWGIW